MAAPSAGRPPAVIGVPGASSGRDLSRSSSDGPSPSLTITPSIGRTSSRVTVRVNQAVEGVPLEPFCFVQDERGQRIRSEDERVQFLWLRSPDMWTCCCYQCRMGRCASADDPMRARGRFPVQCTTCAKAGAPVAPSVFCCGKCMSKYWASHAHSFHPPTPEGGDESKRPELRAAASPDEDEDRLLVDEVETLPPVVRDSTQWVEVGHGKKYVPTAADVGHRLKLRVTARLPGGDRSEETLTKWVQAVAPPPPLRPLVERKTVPPGVRVIDSNLGFRIISYNVLAEIYATQSQYPYCPPWALSFEYRRKLLMSELQRYDADIMCLQEVQADHFNTSLYHDLLAAGYDGVFKAKTRVSMGREGRIDGCALFFRKSRFALHEKYVIEFNDAADATYNLKGKQPQLQPQREALLKRLKRDNVAQVVVLEMTTGLNGAALSTPLRVCVSNTHLSWNPEYDDVKLWQTAMLMKELEKFIMARNVPLVLCGDFNSDTNSAVYKLLASNRGEDRARYVGLNRDELPRDPFNILHGKISHNVILDSAYRTFGGKDPDFTNYTADFVGCLDHAWITTERLLVKSLLEIPSRHILTGYSQTALPNPQFPSDHVALVFDMVPVAPVPGAQQQPTHQFVPPGGGAASASNVPGGGPGVGAGAGAGAGSAANGMQMPQGMGGAGTWHRHTASAPI